MELYENYRNVCERIEKAAAGAGRDPGEITLIAVSKTKPWEMIRDLMEKGQTEFGENHVQEIVQKSQILPAAHFHMIGHLQRNKVRQVVGRARMIHSVDSLRLAEEISKESVKREIVTEILVEINAGNEESKYGFAFSETEDAVRAISLLPGIRVKGLMCVAPFVKDPEENRPLFRKMYDLSVDIDRKRIDNVEMSVLSMGMTNDFEIAIEEGATCVRVGTAIFGAREYKGV